MDNLVSLKELRQKLTQYTKRVKEDGESFIVLRKSKPVFMMVPYTDEGQWSTLVDFTEINPDGVPMDTVLQALEEIDAEESYGRQD